MTGTLEISTYLTDVQALDIEVLWYGGTSGKAGTTVRHWCWVPTEDPEPRKGKGWEKAVPPFPDQSEVRIL